MNLAGDPPGPVAAGRLDGASATALANALFADGRFDRAEIDLLVALRGRVPDRSPGFERFFFRAIRCFMLGADRGITAEAARWLRAALFAGPPGPRGRGLLRELRARAARTCPEFDALCAEHGV